jgi:hypothetical protein
MIFDLITLLLIFLTVRLCIKSVFNHKWHIRVQDIVDSLKKERIFWHLMSGRYEKVGVGKIGYTKLGVNDVYRLYLISMFDELTLGNFLNIKYSETDQQIKNLIKKGLYSGIKNINILVAEEKKVAEIILEILSSSAASFSINEIRENADKNVWASKHYEKFVSIYIGILGDTKQSRYSSSDLWNARIKLQEKQSELEWKSENQKLEPNELAYLKSEETEFNEVISSLLISKMQTDVNLEKLSINIEKYEDIEKLKWCLVDHSLWMLTNEATSIQIVWWRIFALLAK